MRRGVLLATGWALAFAAYAWFLHDVFRSTSMDMALHSQILRNLAKGRFMETSLLPHSFAGHHFWPGLFLLAPVYLGFGIPGILVLQCMIVASGAVAANGEHGPVFLSNDVLLLRRGVTNKALIRKALDRIGRQAGVCREKETRRRRPGSSP